MAKHDAAYSANVPILLITSIKIGGITLTVLLIDVSAKREEIQALAFSEHESK